MYVHGFRSLTGAEVRVYTLNLVSEEKLDTEMEIEVRVPKYLDLAVVSSKRDVRGFDTKRAQLTYAVEGKFKLATHWNIGALSADEVSEINSFVARYGKQLTQWLKKCPVRPLRGRSFSVPEEDDRA